MDLPSSTPAEFRRSRRFSTRTRRCSGRAGRIRAHSLRREFRFSSSDFAGARSTTLDSSGTWDRITHMPNDMGYALVPFFALHLFPLWLGTGELHPAANRLSQHRLRADQPPRGHPRWILGPEFPEHRLRPDSGNNGQRSARSSEWWAIAAPCASSPAAPARRAPIIYDSFSAIDHPYEVYKQLKHRSSVDIKTDWNYPNAMRPGGVNQSGLQIDQYKPQ